MLASALATGLGGYIYLLVLNLVVTQPGELLETQGSETRGTHAVAQLLWNLHEWVTLGGWEGEGDDGIPSSVIIPMSSGLFMAIVRGGEERGWGGGKEGNTGCLWVYVCTYVTWEEPTHHRLGVQTDRRGYMGCIVNVCGCVGLLRGGGAPVGGCL